VFFRVRKIFNAIRTVQISQLVISGTRTFLKTIVFCPPLKASISPTLGKTDVGRFHRARTKSRAAHRLSMDVSRVSKYYARGQYFRRQRSTFRHTNAHSLETHVESPHCLPRRPNVLKIRLQLAVDSFCIRYVFEYGFGVLFNFTNWPLEKSI